MFITAKSRITTYGAAFPSLSLAYSGFVNGEKAEQAFDNIPMVNTTATPASPAGNYPITVLGGASSKYVLRYTNGTFTINKAVLQVTARNQTREQYQANPEFTLKYSGFVNGDTETMLRTIPAGSTSATINSAVGQYAIHVSGGYSPFYTFNYTPAVLTITKATSSSFARTSSLQNDVVVHPAVSPNGDGQNDYLQIDNIEKYTDNEVMILTSSGTLVYKAKGYDNYNNRFDGYSSGGRIKQQPGNYMYVINYYDNGEQKRVTGYLMIK
ncbi:MBG domain-containing protein [Mucilaginibacter terrae]|uniref:MBG domain-containing protein n=1 Tax=Mucilaginibacter terrae TaxID=1955052 RepID=UPI00289E2B9D|nr:MBG domain-containing protein [Mucilaginibacter terrae]